MVKPSVISKTKLEEPVAVSHSPVPPTPPILEYVPKIYYDSYDTKGNCHPDKGAEGTLYSYIWGYGGLYPVAKIMNATYSRVRLAAGLPNTPLSGGLSQQQIDNLYAIEGAYVDIYEYKPHVGLTRHLDPSRKESRYEYDSHGRLTGVHDGLGALRLSSTTFKLRPL